MNVSGDIQKRLRCPICESNIQIHKNELTCSSDACAKRFPIIDEIPILINEATSVFRIEDYQQLDPEQPKERNVIRSLINSIVPSLSLNIKGQENYDLFYSTVKDNVKKRAKVLVVGGEVMGAGMENVASSADIDLLQTDVAVGPQTQLVCDAHDLPFADMTFDGVIVQAVLEHVLDPMKCVDEIHRVLKSNGVVYSETPFMQQVHIPNYDFTRFTHQGHRRLFRYFEEISSGAICGPGMALSWAFEYFLVSFVDKGKLRSGLRAVARFLTFYLKYFDYFLVTKKGAYDSASAFFFLGRKNDVAISDRSIVDYYRGAL